MRQERAEARCGVMVCAHATPLRPDVGVKRGWSWPLAPRHLVSRPQGEIAALDGLRGLAVLLVVWHHVYRWGHADWPLLKLPILSNALDFGFCGVLLFFILSGFLLFLPYARALLAGGPWPSAARFYRRRALRILPVYYAALAVAAGVLFGLGELHGEVLSGLVFSVLLMQNVSRPAANLVATLDGSLWTLAIEWQFYLLLPWIALAVAHIARSRSRRGLTQRVLAVLSLLIIFGLTTRALSAIAFYSTAAPIMAVTRSWVGILLGFISGRYLEEFALGMLVSVLYVLAEQRGWLTRPVVRRLGGIAAGCAIPGLVLCYLWAQRLDVFRAENDWDLIPTAGWSWNVLGIWITTCCFTLLLAGVLFGPGLPRRLFSFAPLRYIGLISYSMYVWHLPLIGHMRQTGLALLIVVLLTLASYYVIERPFLTRRYTPQSTPQSQSAQGSLLQVGSR